VPIEFDEQFTVFGKEKIFIPYSWVHGSCHGMTLHLTYGAQPLILKISSPEGYKEVKFESKLREIEKYLYQANEVYITPGEDFYRPTGKTVALKEYAIYSGVLERTRTIDRVKTILQNPKAQNINLDANKNAVVSDKPDNIWKELESVKEAQIKNSLLWEA